MTEKAIALFQRHGIYAPEEVEARYHVYVDKYVQEILIEARTMVDMVQRDILPACSGYVSDLCRRAQAEQAMGLSAIYETTAARQAGEHIAALQTAYQAQCQQIKYHKTDHYLFPVHGINACNH